MDQTPVGRHAICEFWGASHLNSVGHAERALRAAAEAGKVTLLEVFVHQFAPHGVSGVAVIAESHLAIHTWPEHDYMAADFFTCGEYADLDAVIDTLRTIYEAQRVECRVVDRGVPAASFQESEPFAATHTSYDVAQVLEQRRTQYQDLMLFESPRLGRVLALDGIVQMTDLDSYVYHEVLAHPALHTHPAPRDVAIVGGGDMHLVGEVRKHRGVDHVYLLELDEEVVRVAHKHYELAREALADPRVEVRPGDAFESIAALRGALDVILVDLTDPIGPAARLFEGGFYALCAQALRDDGMIVAQTESLHFHAHTVRACYSALADQFAHADLLWGAIATYPGAFWTFGVGSKSLDPRVVRRRPAVATRLYDPDAHEWFFVPPVVRRRLVGA